jgi:mono/diheme cytochrome c family protein
MERQRIVCKPIWARILLLLCTVLLVAACGGGSSTEETGAATGGQPVVPTMPPAKFTAVAEQHAITTTSVVSATAALTQTAQASAQDLERGATIYVNRKCGECHGAQGEGVADKGSALAGTPLALQEFETILRTGGNGELGPDHLYGQSAISPGGMRVLHAWLQSLLGQ